ncbi:hypothetical protein Cgig2_027365 [Carnegiea gigantea]|uniref:Uncharacterized protein n=1 Tax=Carnegiea gigantea TaxID=171969 RepID=A0A9Q1JFW2_9CARY|nr:hypothetical protein Cgig2_027365 [Carnegiea gigantea]
MKLAEGRRVNEEVSLTPAVAAPVPWEGVGYACLAVGPRSPHLQRGRCHGLPRGSLDPLLFTDRQAHSGPLPVRYKGGHLQEKVKPVFQEKLREEELINSYTIPFWPAEQQEVASVPPAYARQRPPLVQEWYPQSQRPLARPSLNLHETNRKSVPLVKFLRIRRPAVARKKSFAKCFSLGSQFNGSRSLDLLLLFSCPFTDSIA